MFFSTSCVVKEEDGTEIQATTYGVPALEMAWTSMSKQEPKDIDLSQIELLASFTSWLSVDVAGELSKKKTAVLKAKMSKSGKSAPAASKPTKAKKQSADERALEMAKKFVKKRKTD
eukprot:285124-Amphidinium_carterae.1